jgi:hypothetical protein
MQLSKLHIFFLTMSVFYFFILLIQTESPLARRYRRKQAIMQQQTTTLPLNHSSSSQKTSTDFSKTRRFKSPAWRHKKSKNTASSIEQQKDEGQNQAFPLVKAVYTFASFILSCYMEYKLILENQVYLVNINFGDTWNAIFLCFVASWFICLIAALIFSVKKNLNRGFNCTNYGMLPISVAGVAIFYWALITDMFQCLFHCCFGEEPKTDVIDINLPNNCNLLNPPSGIETKQMNETLPLLQASDNPGPGQSAKAEATKLVVKSLEDSLVVASHNSNLVLASEKKPPSGVSAICMDTLEAHLRNNDGDPLDILNELASSPLDNLKMAVTTETFPDNLSNFIIVHMSICLSEPELTRLSLERILQYLKDLADANSRTNFLRWILYYLQNLEGQDTDSLWNRMVALRNIGVLMAHYDFPEASKEVNRWLIGKIQELTHIRDMRVVIYLLKKYHANSDELSLFQGVDSFLLWVLEASLRKFKGRLEEYDAIDCTQWATIWKPLRILVLAGNGIPSDENPELKDLCSAFKTVRNIITKLLTLSDNDIQDDNLFTLLNFTFYLRSVMHYFHFPSLQDIGESTISPESHQPCSECFSDTSQLFSAALLQRLDDFYKHLQSFIKKTNDP